MPIYCDPEKKSFEIILKKDAEKDVPPVFYGKIMSMRDSIKIAKLCDDMNGNSSSEKALEIMGDIIKCGITGWDNMPDPDNLSEKMEYNPDKLVDILSIPEANELIEKIQSQGVLDNDLKN